MAKMQPISGIDGAFKTEDGKIIFRSEKPSKSLVEKREEEKAKLMMETKAVDIEARINLLESKLNIVIDALIKEKILNKKQIP